MEQLPLPFLSIRPDTIAEAIEEPYVEQVDKIPLIINNLAPSNFEAKAAEMQERFQDEHARWFANYLVDQRVSTEPIMAIPFVCKILELGKNSVVFKPPSP